ncbi:MAG: hypothetical protein ACW99A_21690 [Candidatus Kariarchaeaceae archaeon]|jgi:hypothetical protein
MKTNNIYKIKDKTMKHLITLSLVLLFFGCDQSSDITSPVNDVKTDNANWISLPQPKGMHIENSFTVTKRINGSKGGFLTMSESYSGGPFGNVTIDAELVFDPGAFPGNKYISMTNDDLGCVATFEPSFDNFRERVTYTVTYTGIDLTGIDPDNVKFAYIDYTGMDLSGIEPSLMFSYIGSIGVIEYAQHEGITVDVSAGTIQVVNALIPHFSRYGFVN